jgi:hypothetical protein
MGLFSEDIVNELRDRVQDVFAPLDQDTRLAVERVMRVRLGIGDRMDIDPWQVFAARMYRTTQMIEREWTIHKMRRQKC